MLYLITTYNILETTISLRTNLDQDPIETCVGSYPLIASKALEAATATADLNACQAALTKGRAEAVSNSEWARKLMHERDEEIAHLRTELAVRDKVRASVSASASRCKERMIERVRLVCVLSFRRKQRKRLGTRRMWR